MLNSLNHMLSRWSVSCSFNVEFWQKCDWKSRPLLVAYLSGMDIRKKLTELKELWYL